MIPAQYLVNLDDMSTEWRDYTSYARLIEGDDIASTDPSTARKLASYARFKADSMLHRLEGRIIDALDAERQMEQIYSSLPSYAKW